MEREVLRAIATAAREKAGAVSVLFTGTDAEAKARAATAVAETSAAKLLRVDLAEILSKYVGETEKHLDAVFAQAERSGAVLFFDEADALFGARGDVKDSHDRYENIEVAYLLKRIEAFHGIVILATNLRKNIDDAFVRRFRYVVDL